MTREEKILAIFNKHSYTEQRNKLCEEFRELQDELLLQYLNSPTNNFLGECADVINLILQFVYARGYNTNELLDELDFKIDRQCKRDGIEEEGQR